MDFVFPFLFECIWKKIALHSFLELSFTQIELIRSTLEKLSRISGVFNSFDAIVIRPKSEHNPQTDWQNFNGRAWIAQKCIWLYPEALQNIPHRISTVSNLEWTIIHEFWHGLINNNNKLRREWNNAVGWRQGNLDSQRNRGYWTGEHLEKPEWALNDYARSLPEEDFCDSFVAYNVGYKELEDQRNAFLKDQFPLWKPTSINQSEQNASTTFWIPRVIPYSVRRSNPIQFL